MTATTNIETEAFVVDSPNAPFKLTPIILDEMREDEFLVEMKYSGICHTVSGCILIFSGDRSFGTGSRQRRPNLSQSREPS